MSFRALTTKLWTSISPKFAYAIQSATTTSFSMANSCILLFLRFRTSITVSKFSTRPLQLSIGAAPFSIAVIVSHITTNALIPAPMEIRAVELSPPPPATPSLSAPAVAGWSAVLESCCLACSSGELCPPSSTPVGCASGSRT